MTAAVLSLGLIALALTMLMHLRWHSRQEQRRLAANARVLAEVHQLLEDDEPTPPQAA